MILKILFQFRIVLVTTPLVIGLMGCSNNGTEEAILDVWVHTARSGTHKVVQQQVKRFNAAQDEITVQLTILPEESYNAHIHKASQSGKLPDILEFDGPYVYNYVWQKLLIPLDNLLSEQVQQDLLPSIVKQGTYNNHLYSVGAFDSGVVLYARRSQLQAIGARIPTQQAEAWSAAEFNQILADLAQSDRDGQVLDLKLNYQGEWYTFAFSPIIQSAGGDLINRNDYQSAAGKLNGSEAVAVMQQVQSWIQNGYVDPNTDDAAFTEGRVALAWGGHWVYQDYATAVGDDLVLIPLPDFGQGSKTAQGSWVWGITTQCKNPQAAARFLEFLLQPQEVLAVTNANKAVPGSKTAITQSKLYAKGQPLDLFSRQLLSGQTIPRPQIPNYPVISVVFQKAFDEIRQGNDVKRTLDKAVAIIDQDIKDNQGYR